MQSHYDVLSKITQHFQEQIYVFTFYLTYTNRKYKKSHKYNVPDVRVKLRRNWTMLFFAGIFPGTSLVGDVNNEKQNGEY